MVSGVGFQPANFSPATAAALNAASMVGSVAAAPAQNSATTGQPTSTMAASAGADLSSALGTLLSQLMSVIATVFSTLLQKTGNFTGSPASGSSSTTAAATPAEPEKRPDKASKTTQEAQPAEAAQNTGTGKGGDVRQQILDKARSYVGKDINAMRSIITPYLGGEDFLDWGWCHQFAAQPFREILGKNAPVDVSDGVGIESAKAGDLAILGGIPGSGNASTHYGVIDEIVKDASGRIIEVFTIEGNVGIDGGRNGVRRRSYTGNQIPYIKAIDVIAKAAA